MLSASHREINIETKTYSKVAHVSKEGVDLDDLLDGGASGLEDSLEVLDAGSGLLLDGTLDKVAVRVAGNLARAVYGSRGLDGVRVGAGS